MTKDEQVCERARLDKAVRDAEQGVRDAKARVIRAKRALERFNALHGPRCEPVSVETLHRFNTWSARELFRRLDEDGH